MKLTRRELKIALKSVAARPIPEADPFFLEALEHRLTSGRVGFEELRPTPNRGFASAPSANPYLAPVIPLRRTRPLVGAAAAVFVLGIGTVAVAAPWHRSTNRVQTATQVDPSTPSIASRPATSGSLVASLTTTSVLPTAAGTAPVGLPTVDQATQVPTAVVSSTEVPVTSTLVGTGSSPTTASRLSPTSTTRQEIATSLSATTAAPTVTVVTTTAPSTTALASTVVSTRSTVAPTTSTTEVSVPAAMTIGCTVITSTSVRCTWSRSTDPGVVGYRLLRGVASGPGRVFSTGAGDATYTDSIASPGTDYTYLVHAVRSDGSSIAHSPAAAIHCCTPA